MIKDMIFVLIVLSAAVYAHSYKSDIVNFIVNEEEEEDVSVKETSLYSKP